jgi:cytosine/adenosine deaminase-related metal-dependent hydrolase
LRLLVEASNLAVGVENGLIVEPEGAFDTVLRFPRGLLLPGLINCHDHLHRNHYGRLGNGPYVSSYDWGRDIQRRHADAIAHGRRVPRRRALLRGAWKNLLSGVTTVVHHDRCEPDFDQEFPGRVAPVRWAHSIGLEPEVGKAASGEGPFAIHLAEGTDARAADEVRELDRFGLLNRDLLAVHAVGLDADGIGRLRAAGATVVWCPSSNLFLLGRTASAGLLAAGTDVLLGSDSLLSGAGTLLDEIRVARELGLISDERLEQAVSDVAARRLRLPPPSLEPGAAADLVVLARPLLDAGAADVAMVVVGGVLRVLEPRSLPALGETARWGRLVREEGVVRWVNQRRRLPFRSRHPF